MATASPRTGPDDAFRLLVESVKDYAIFMLDGEGRIVSWNAGAERIKGYTASQIIGRHFSTFYPVEDVARGKPQSELDAAMRDGRVVDEGWRVRRDGTRFWASVVLTALRDERGDLRGFAKVTRDMTERRIADEERARLLARLRNVLAISDTALAHVQLDALLGTLLARIEEILAVEIVVLLLIDDGALVARAARGLDEQALSRERIPLGAGFAGRVAAKRTPLVLNDARPDDVLSAELRARRVRSLLGAPLIVEGVVVGVLQAANLTARVFTDDDIALLQMVADRAAVAIDRARLYEAEHAARAALEARVVERTIQLEEINAELRGFAHTISHDLQAPVRALEGLTQALLEDYGDRFDDLGREYARTIVAAATQMHQLIDDLLAYSRLSAVEVRPQPVSLDEAVGTVLARLHGEIESRSATIRVEAPLGSVRAHRAVLEQAVVNLLSNALKFVPPGTKPSVRVFAQPRGDRRRLWIEDNGIGVEPVHRERIFKVFERLHGAEAFPGTGIGLAIVLRTMQRLGGATGVEGAPGGGSRFWIELPQAA